jgi:hypothetical protein
VLRERRPGYSRTVWIIVAVIVVAAVAAGEYAIGLGSGKSNGTREIDLHIIEDDPIQQIDHFYPNVLYAQAGQNISLAIQNTDDETRSFTVLEYNINISISAGSTERITFQPNKVGNFSFVTPVAPPSVVSQGRLAPCLIGTFFIVQNISALATTSSSGQGLAGSTYCNPSDHYQNPPGYPAYNGPNPLNEH